MHTIFSSRTCSYGSPTDRAAWQLEQIAGRVGEIIGRCKKNETALVVPNLGRFIEGLDLQTAAKLVEPVTAAISNNNWEARYEFGWSRHNRSLLNLCASPPNASKQVDSAASKTGGEESTESVRKWEMLDSLITIPLKSPGYGGVAIPWIGRLITELGLETVAKHTLWFERDLGEKGWQSRLEFPNSELKNFVRLWCEPVKTDDRNRSQK